MELELIQETPLAVAATAARTCWDSFKNKDSVGIYCGEKDKELILRVGKKYKHASILEHVNIFMNLTDIFTDELTSDEHNLLLTLQEDPYIYWQESSGILIINARTILEKEKELQWIIDRIPESKIVDLLLNENTKGDKCSVM